MRGVTIHIANVVLFTLCCFLIASVFNKISAEFLMIAPAAVSPALEVERQQTRSWEERQPILERNLFDVQIETVAAPPPPEPAEDLAETELPLRLLGTVASAWRDSSRATIEDKTSRKHEVVQIGDYLQSHTEVAVAAIERGRVVLLNDGRREELLLQEDSPKAAPAPKRTSRRSRSRRGETRSETQLGSLAERLKDLQSESGLSRTAADLLTQAKLTPKYEDGEMTGMQIRDVQEGSLYEKLGLKDGDVISSVNGISIDSAAAGSKILRQFSQADEFEIELPDRTITVSADDLPGFFAD
jgi:type II secretion system protein C